MAIIDIFEVEIALSSSPVMDIMFMAFISLGLSCLLLLLPLYDNRGYHDRHFFSCYRGQVRLVWPLQLLWPLLPFDLVSPLLLHVLRATCFFSF